MRMKKRAYRAQDLKTLDRTKLAEAVKGGCVIVATDVAKVDMVSSVELWDGTLVGLVKWKHPVELRGFVDLVIELSKEAMELSCVQEPTGTYGDPLRAALELAGFCVNRAPTKRVHDLREAYDGTPSSHDPKAARIIAEVHRRGWSAPWEEKSPGLHALQRSYEWFADEKQRLTGRLEARLARHWPEVLGQLDLDSATLLELLRRYGGPSALASQTDSARQLMRTVGRCFLKSEKIEAVVQSAMATVGVAMEQQEIAELSLLARELLRVKDEITQCREALQSANKCIPFGHNVAEVVGQTTAVVLFAFLGDPRNYASAAAYIKAAGLNLREQSSGTKKGTPGITKRGPGVVRGMMYFAVMRLVHSDPFFKAWHESKLRRSAKGQGKKSIIALMRKLLGGLWHVGSGNEWDPSRLFAPNLVPAAQ